MIYLEHQIPPKHGQLFFEIIYFFVNLQKNSQHI